MLVVIICKCCCKKKQSEDKAISVQTGNTGPQTLGVNSGQNLQQYPELEQNFGNVALKHPHYLEYQVGYPRKVEQMYVEDYPALWNSEFDIKQSMILDE